MRGRKSASDAGGLQKLGASNVRRREIADNLHDVLHEGTTSEWDNALEEVRNELGFIEGRIRDLQRILATAEIICEPGRVDLVVMGSKVTVIELDGDGRPETYQLVGAVEADPTKGRISDESPLGRALIGRRVGEEAVVDAPGGRTVFRVVAIE